MIFWLYHFFFLFPPRIRLSPRISILFTNKLLVGFRDKGGLSTIQSFTRLVCSTATSHLYEWILPPLPFFKTSCSTAGLDFLTARFPLLPDCFPKDARTILTIWERFTPFGKIDFSHFKTSSTCPLRDRPFPIPFFVNFSPFPLSILRAARTKSASSQVPISRSLSTHFLSLSPRTTPRIVFFFFGQCHQYSYLVFKPPPAIRWVFPHPAPLLNSPFSISSSLVFQPFPLPPQPSPS